MDRATRYTWGGTHYFYLASFPRSGNHFVRYMIDDVLGPHYHHANPIFKRTLGFTRVVWPTLSVGHLAKAKLVMVKTHLQYQHCHSGIPVVYLVRDPRDSLLSYYHYNCKYHDYTESFDGFFQRFVVERRLISKRERVLANFMGDWRENALSFLDSPWVLTKRYEDLLDDTATHLEEICRFVAIDPDVVDRLAVEQAVTMAEQRLAEKRSNTAGRTRGVSGSWHSHFSDEQATIIQDLYGDVMTEYGYAG
ncbi:sulfotransferase domain-containing protein [Parasphingorhabdus sp.]|uniref:sulfotransferase domain-containing protein n=1 Tax=Parasphingorhabdus sp. TaxID=2709688 RepID=UPI0032F0140A